MVLTAGFDPAVISAAPSEGRRRSESEPDSERVTPVAETDPLQADTRRADASDEPPRPPARLAFTAKFGPDKDGFPLQLVSGADLEGAEAFDFQVINARRLSTADRALLLRAQEDEIQAEETSRQRNADEAQVRNEADRAAEQRAGDREVAAAEDQRRQRELREEDRARVDLQI